MNEATLYKCPECGLHYEDEDIAKKCETFCQEHSACNLEITQYAVENKKAEQAGSA